jgi:hypothetical protein
VIYEGPNVPLKSVGYVSVLWGHQHSRYGLPSPPLNSALRGPKKVLFGFKMLLISKLCIFNVKITDKWEIEWATQQLVSF